MGPTQHNMGVGELVGTGLKEAGFTGDRWSVKHLQSHVQIDLCISLGIFVISNAVTAATCPFWRPVFWDVFWIVLAILIGAFGIYGCRKKYSFVILSFILGVVMLGCVNIAHLMAMHSEHVRTCELNQASFKHCVDNPLLTKCLAGNTCLRDVIKETDCKAPGHEHCEGLSSLGYAFAANILISFITFAEPAYWAGIYLIRLEMSYPLTPDEEDESNETDESKALLSKGKTANGDSPL